MYFASDNWAGAHPSIAARLVEEAPGFAAPYGVSDLDRKVEARLSEIFECDVSVFFVATGTAANSLALASVGKPGGVIFCHSEAHVTADECGAPEFITGANRLHTIPGLNGKMDPKALEAAIWRFAPGAVHQGRAAAVTLTQSTEVGTIYSLAEIDAIAAIARAHGLPLHMDGARFANALVRLDATPAEMTWKRGVDILSFGGTKNGCWCAEAVIFFNRELAADMPYLRKRSAQLFSKTRFISAQFDAYLEDGLWLTMAKNANDMAERLSAGLEALNSARLAWPSQANEVFAVLPGEKAAAAEAAGARFYRWDAPRDMPGLLEDGEVLIRLVTSFATTREDVEAFLSICSA
ncbi:low specificity L-threonine aldolase [Rhizobiaceae bacterium BDR2-2]|uniref:L-threonine aldolase n=1 Tax=Ectorhizobium quercum TaxID=2965071 RepID=A0AAE3SVD0_9HYPH|nr:low specificity L-threonine aldolase [Ectorhizobium quercum]MCX8996834.1 low specificity L-threonine aldolase [Ectorhizobium quercum]